MGRLEGKAVVVTGAGRGLGRSYAMGAARDGASVVVNDLVGGDAKAVCDEITAAGGAAVDSDHDVRDLDAARGLVDLCTRTYGHIDGLVNNAAILTREDPWAVDPALVDNLIRTNVVGVLHCGAAVMGPMRQQGSGVIVNIISGAHLGMPELSVYGASKGAVASATYAWALELASSGVRVNGFSPLGRSGIGGFDRWGNVPDPWHDGAPDPDTVAPAVVFLLSDAAKGLSGQILRFDGTRLSLLRQPAYVEPVISAERWDVDAVVAAVDAHLRPNVGPVGMSPTDLGAV